MEFEELRVYKEIWYFGQNANKNYSNKVSASATNMGYDDDNGNYKIVSENSTIFFLINCNLFFFFYYYFFPD